MAKVAQVSNPACVHCVAWRPVMGLDRPRGGTAQGGRGAWAAVPFRVNSFSRARTPNRKVVRAPVADLGGISSAKMERVPAAKWRLRRAWSAEWCKGRLTSRRVHDRLRDVKHA